MVKTTNNYIGVSCNLHEMDYEDVKLLIDSIVKYYSKNRGDIKAINGSIAKFVYLLAKISFLNLLEILSAEISSEIDSTPNLSQYQSDIIKANINSLIELASETSFDSEEVINVYQSLNGTLERFVTSMTSIKIDCPTEHQ